MAIRRIFWGFCRNRFLIDPLQYLSSRSDFSSEFTEIFVIEKRLPNSVSRGVGDSPTRLLNVKKKNRRVGESASRGYISQKNLIPRMLSHRENVRTLKFWRKSKEKKIIFFRKFTKGIKGFYLGKKNSKLSHACVPLKQS